MICMNVATIKKATKANTFERPLKWWIPNTATLAFVKQIQVIEKMTQNGPKLIIYSERLH